MEKVKIPEVVVEDDVRSQRAATKEVLSSVVLPSESLQSDRSRHLLITPRPHENHIITLVSRQSWLFSEPV